MSLQEKWDKAMEDSRRRFKNMTLIASDVCVDADGVFCDFLRQMTVREKGIFFLFTRCVFEGKCIKQYPELGDYEELK